MKMSWNRILSLGILVGLAAPFPASGAEKRDADGHAHGIAEINIAIEGKKIAVELLTPTEGLMGFEHEATTDAEKKKRDAAVRILESRFDELVILDRKLGCKSKPGKVTVVRSESHDRKETKRGHGDGKRSGEHREARVAFEYECQQSPAGSRVQFGVTKLFPEIHELKIQVLSDAKQSGATIKKDKGEVRL
jgi:hypothetical protein